MIRTRKETHTHTTKNVYFQSHPPTLRRLPSALRALDKSARIPGRIARRDDHKRGPYEHMHPPILWGILCGTHVYADPLGDLIVEQMHPPNSGGFCVAFFVFVLVFCVPCFHVSGFGYYCTCFLILVSFLCVLSCCFFFFFRTIIQTFEHKNTHRARCTPSVNAVARGLPTMRCSR